MVPGLNLWCRNHGFSAEISNALRQQNLWQDDVNRLKEIRSLGKGADANLSDKLVAQHKLKELAIHHSKHKDGSVKLFWPKDSPTAKTFEGKGKGKGSSKAKGDNPKQRPDKPSPTRKVRFGGESTPRKNNAKTDCWRCGNAGCVFDGNCLVCRKKVSDMEEADPAQPTSTEEEQESDMQNGPAVEEEPGVDPHKKLKALRNSLTANENIITKMRSLFADTDPHVMKLAVEVGKIKS